MGFHCAPGDEQAPTDLDVGESLTHQPYHLELGGSETFPIPSMVAGEPLFGLGGYLGPAGPPPRESDP